MGASGGALVAQRAKLAADLAGTYVDLGQTRAAAIRTRASAWAGTAGLPVTERREEVRVSTADLDAEVVELEGDAEALKVQIGQIDAEMVAERFGVISGGA